MSTDGKKKVIYTLHGIKYYERKKIKVQGTNKSSEIEETDLVPKLISYFSTKRRLKSALKNSK